MTQNLIRTILMFVVIASGVCAGTDIITTQKKLKAQKENDITEFVLTYPIFIKAIMVVGLVMCIYLFYYGIEVLRGKRTGDFDIITIIGFAIFGLLFMYGVMGTVIWKVEFKNNVFIHRNYFGIKRKIPASEVTKVVDRENKYGQSSFRVYSGDKKLFTIDEMTENMYTFYFWAQKNNVEIEHVQSMHAV